MANHLKMAKIHAIVTLHEGGWSNRRIARELGVDRETVGRHLALAVAEAARLAANRPLEDWGKLLGDVPSATAILDRFLHHTEIISITGRSYRLKDRAAKEPAAKDRSTKGEKDAPDDKDPCQDTVK